MDIKTVSHAVSGYIRPDNSEKVERALSLLIAKDGAFRTDEKWVYAALRDIIGAGYVNVDGNTLCIGANFGTLLNELATANPRFWSLVIDYRTYQAHLAAEYTVADDTVAAKLETLKSTDAKLAYLTQVVSDTFGRLEAALARTQMLEAKLRELDISLSIMESITFEDSDQ